MTYQLSDPLGADNVTLWSHETHGKSSYLLLQQLYRKRLVSLSFPFCQLFYQLLNLVVVVEIKIKLFVQAVIRFWSDELAGN